VADLKDRLLRTLADRENERRRAARDRDDAVRFAASEVVKDLLPAIDNMRRAIESVPEDRAGDDLLASLLAGIEVTERSLLDAFTRHGVTRVQPQPGERFDPNRHHAMAEVPSADCPAATVVELLQPGYMYRDRLLRPALVSVAKAADERASE
jgi:molecular chaperone GrpE